MFKVGDTVRNVARNVVGVVTEIDGDTVYLEQANGCEVDFVTSALVLEQNFQAKHDTMVRDDAGSHANDSIYDSVLENLYPAIVEIGQLGHAQVKPVPGVAVKTWEELSSLQKLNVISAATEISVKTWIDANQPGARTSLGALQISILSARGKTPST
jgi:hypothetical protein